MYFLHLNTCTSQQQHHHDQQQQARGFVKHTVHGSLLTQEGLLASQQQSHHQNNSFPVGNSTTSIVSFCDFITSKISKIYRLYTLVHLTKYIQLHTNLLQPFSNTSTFGVSFLWFPKLMPASIHLSVTKNKIKIDRFCCLVF